MSSNSHCSHEQVESGINLYNKRTWLAHVYGWVMYSIHSSHMRSKPFFKHKIPNNCRKCSQFFKTCVWIFPRESCCCLETTQLERYVQIDSAELGHKTKGINFLCCWCATERMLYQDEQACCWKWIFWGF